MTNHKSILEFGTSKIICMIDTSEIREMDVPAASCVRYEGFSNGSWINSAALTKPIEDAVNKTEHLCNKQIKDIYVSVPSDFSVIIKKEITSDVSSGILTLKYIKELINLNKPVNMGNYTLIDVVPFYFKDSNGAVYYSIPDGIRTAAITIMLSYFYADNEFVYKVKEILDGLQINIIKFVNEAKCLSIKYIPKAERSKTAVLLDVGYRSTAISAVFNNTVLKTDVYPIGGELITNELAERLRISQSTAEHLKRGNVFGLSLANNTPAYAKNEYGKMLSFNQLYVREIIEDCIYDLCEKAVRSMNGFYKNGILDKKANIYITGGGLAINGANIYIENIIHKHISVVSNRFKQSFPPIYNTAFSILDNDLNNEYDLIDGVYPKNGRSKFGKFLKK